jgi:hypothetical protein
MPRTLEIDENPFVGLDHQSLLFINEGEVGMQDEAGGRAKNSTKQPLSFALKE